MNQRFSGGSRVGSPEDTGGSMADIGLGVSTRAGASGLERGAPGPRDASLRGAPDEGPDDGATLSRSEGGARPERVGIPDGGVAPPGVDVPEEDAVD
jgi:hypothetical protein